MPDEPERGYDLIQIGEPLKDQPKFPKVERVKGRTETEEGYDRYEI